MKSKPKLLSVTAVRPTVFVYWEVTDALTRDTIKSLADEYGAENTGGGTFIGGDGPNVRDEVFEFDTYEKAQQFELQLREDFDVEEES